MSYDAHHTIAAIASAAGGAARGVVRVSGANAVSTLARCFSPEDSSSSLLEVRSPRRVAGSMHVDGDGDQAPLDISGHLLLWPSARSYTREPAVEFHTVGSPPLLAAIVEQLGRLGVRAAGPGEFTLRAFLAGRVDLTQAEAVLGVIDACNRDDLDAALDQLAGGLSRPLHRLREQLLGVLAELEAGLDFVEEDIEFISRGALRERLREAEEVVAATVTQLSTRAHAVDAPRVVIAGPPNAGKSSLFNALVERWGVGASAGAIVSPQPGATRDYVVAGIDLGGVQCELVDTAGVDDGGRGEIDGAAQQTAAHQKRRASLRLACIDACDAASERTRDMRQDMDIASVAVITKIDLADASDLIDIDIGWSQAPALRCSSVTGVGLDALVDHIRTQLGEAGSDAGSAAAATSARCAGSLRDTQMALGAAVMLIGDGGDELIAAEIRSALDSLGEVVGAISTDDVLDRVFSQFCIGK